MALFGSVRDSNLFKSINRELLHNIIDTEVLVYQVNTSETPSNFYGESDKMIYYTPTLIHALVTLDEPTWNDTDFGADVSQTATFAFLKDDLVSRNIKPEPGDIIEYKSGYYELDSIAENQFVAGKDPESWFGGDTFGASISIIYNAHLTRISALNIVPIRYGANQPITKQSTLPSNI
jgi:hypothetical protein